MNKVFMIGNLVKDPELTTTPNSISVCRFSIAINRRFGTAENGGTNVDFFNIVVWRALADNCGKYLKKGSKVGLSGTIQNRSFDGNDGQKRYMTEIIADEVQFLNTKNDGEDGQSYSEPPKSNSYSGGKKNIIEGLTPIQEDEGLPF